MVEEKNYIKRKDGKLFKVKQNLTCNNYGIYAAQCLVCDQTYVGQSKNKFSTRFNAHRKNWKDALNGILRQNEFNKDENALFNHYQKFHKINQDKLEFDQAYKIIFVEQPAPHNLNLAESTWASDLEAEINVAKMFLPRYK